MAYQPTYPSPYMEAIDVTQEGGNIFKCLINPKDTILDATINIYYNTDSSLVKTIELEDSTFPFVGGLSDNSWLQCLVDNKNLTNKRDYKWAITLTFDEYEIVGSGSVSSASTTSVEFPYNLSLYNRLKDGHTYYITVNSERIQISGVGYSYDGSTYTSMHVNLKTPFSNTPVEGDIFDIDADHLILTSPEYYFKARTKPLVTFDVPETISNSTYTFTATYSQEQKVGIAYFQYELYNKNELIATSGKVFTQNILHTFENLVNGTEYVIKLTIVNNDGVEMYEERTFGVDYPIMATAINPVIAVDNCKTCVSVDFSNNASIPATLVGTDNVNYKAFGDPDYVIVSSGSIVAYSSPLITIEPYDNIMPNMYIKIGGEVIRIVSYTRQEDETIIATLENGFSTDPLIGSPYEICSYFNGINLDEGEAILWDNVNDKPLVIPDRSSQVIHWHGSHGFNGLILEKINSEFVLGSTTVSYGGENFTYKLGTSEAVNYCPYVGVASAIAGNDEHSIIGHVRGYNPSTPSITLESSEFISVGRTIQIGNEYRTISGVSEESGNLVVTLDRVFDIEPQIDDIYAVYDENYLYILADDDELSDDDILIDNDLSYKYWWLIVLLPDSVRFIKTVPFTESEV